MALSKTFLLLGLALALVLLISSEVSSARELAEATHAQSAEDRTRLDETKYETDHYWYGHGYGHGHKYGHGKGYGHGGYGHYGKPGHGGHPGHGADGVETEDGGN
ncbi:hypothetical protein AB3S75_017716 [Citrus x aurantiifolia]